jgi:pimeloyl-ACP methyl ester carboxylesterase
MIPLVFMPGFDGEGSLRKPFLDALARHHEVHAVTYPHRRLGSLEGYRDHAMASIPVDCRPVLIAESFSGLVATRWAEVDSRVRGVVLCGAFARNPVGWAARAGASMPGLLKVGPKLMHPLARASGDPARARWSDGFIDVMARLPTDVIAERLRLIAAADTAAALRALCVPVLVVQFAGDQVIGLATRDHLESVCHNAQVLHLPGPHFAIEVRPQECADAIGGRIREIFPTGA